MGDVRFDRLWREWEKVAPDDHPTPASAAFLERASDETLVHLLSSEGAQRAPFSRNIIASALARRLGRIPPRDDAGLQTLLASTADRVRGAQRAAAEAHARVAATERTRQNAGRRVHVREDARPTQPGENDGEQGDKT